MAGTLPACTELVYRDYCDKDDLRCKALEMRAMQGGRFPAVQKLLSFFFRAGFEHFVTFDAKAKQYDEHIIRVVEDRASNNRLVGVGCAVLKMVRIKSEVCKVGYVFDLRVDEDYQSHGVGKTLTHQIEEACESRGAKFLYLTVNANNTKAKALYRKRGFVHASHRAPSMSLLVHPQRADIDDDIIVERISVEEALQMTETYYKHSDLALGSMAVLFQSKLCQGTFVARRGTSFAGASTWNGSFLTGFRVDRVVLPVACWNCVFAKSVLFSGASYAALQLLWAYQATYMRARASRSTDELLLFASMSLFSATLVATLWYVWPALSFLARKVISGDTKLRHRIFGPFGNGPSSEQELLMRIVLRKIHNTARADGYALSICNMDRDHPLRGCFPSSRFSTIFLYKQLTQVGSSVELEPLSPDNFFDPRDL